MLIRFDGEKQANGFSPNWGATIFQSANEMANNDMLKKRLEDNYAGMGAEKEKWEVRRQVMRDGFMRELEGEGAAAATRAGGGGAEVRKKAFVISSSDEDAVMVEKEKGGDTRLGAGGGGAKKKKKVRSSRRAGVWEGGKASS